MENKEQIDDLVKMLDRLTASGNGHIEVKVEDSNTSDEPSVETINSQACVKGKACQVPTLHEGLDNK